MKMQQPIAVQQQGLRVPRYFTQEGIHPFDLFTYEKRSSVIKNPDGSLVFEMHQVEVPTSWTQVAADILAQKYFRKAGVPLRNEKGDLLRDVQGKVITGSENSIKQVAHRIAGCWRHWGEQYGYFATPEDAQIFYEEMIYMLIGQVAAPNSPQWFTTGLHWAYGITGPAQGHSYVDPITKKLEYSKDAYTRSQPHACFIQSISDDLVRDGGIFSLLTREARVFKYGSGTGSNFSSLRAKGEKLMGGGSSSGLMSFLKIFDAAAGSIKSGGTTRRAAKMVCLDLDHPEIEEFIRWKVKEEQKVAGLVTGSKILSKRLKKLLAAAQGHSDPLVNPAVRKALKHAAQGDIPLNYLVRALDLAQQGQDLELPEFDTHYESEAYLTVSGQNSNNSVRIPNVFFEVLEQKGLWELKGRQNGAVMRKIPAEKLWDDIAYCAWASADPGLQFDTTLNEWHTCPEDGRINASNPCGEYNFLDDTACNLASINLMKFYDEETGTFDVIGYRHAVRLWTIALEISVLMAQFPSEEIALRSYVFRTLGLGYANLGTLLLVQGIPYDSDQGRAIGGALAAIMTGDAYATSAEMARTLGPFEGYARNKEHMLRVIRNHRRAAYDDPTYEGLTISPPPIPQLLCPPLLREAAHDAWDHALEWGKQWGYRNAQATVIAPTGTIALVMSCDTTGIEPDYSLVKFKKLAGGGYFKIVNQAVPSALRNLGYSELQVQEIISYCIGHGSFSGSPFINSESLLQRGLNPEQITAVEKELPSAMDIRYVFNSHTLGAEQWSSVTRQGKRDFLAGLGFRMEEITAANEFICGTMTVEGAPSLKAEHYPVFDCANKCGNKGKRYIHPYGHLKMLAAVQSFISGAISKTINMPREWTVQQIKQAHYDAWKMMVKALALYRDGCKLSQPLNSTLEEYPEMKKLLEETEEEGSSEIIRRVLLGKKELTLRGQMEEGQLKSIAWNMAGLTPAHEAIAAALINTVNTGLRHGILPSVLAEQALTIEGHPLVGELRSFLGACASQTPETTARELSPPVASLSNGASLNTLEDKAEKMKCRGCGASQMRQNGVCLLCEVCGETSGCS